MLVGASLAAGSFRHDRRGRRTTGVLACAAAPPVRLFFLWSLSRWVGGSTHMSSVLRMMFRTPMLQVLLTLMLDHMGEADQLRQFGCGIRLPDGDAQQPCN